MSSMDMLVIGNLPKENARLTTGKRSMTNPISFAAMAST
jgi:hypothetical protein